jgi:nucleotide-binding universal stress UspA family protein
MYASILVPLDGSRALAQAVPIAEQRGAKLIRAATVPMLVVPPSPAVG